MSLVIFRNDPPIELNTPKGVGVCHWIKDYGLDGSTVYVVIAGDGQIWDWQQHEVRGVRNFSADRPDPEIPPRRPEIDRYATSTPKNDLPGEKPQDAQNRVVPRKSWLRRIFEPLGSPWMR